MPALLEKMGLVCRCPKPNRAGGVERCGQRLDPVIVSGINPGEVHVVVECRKHKRPYRRWREYFGFMNELQYARLQGRTDLWGEIDF
jgi:hypothetical protein